MDKTRQDSGSNAHSVTGTPTIQQTSRRTQTGAAIRTQVAIATQSNFFELFGEFPPELKTKILNIAAREVPRTIEMIPQGNHRGYTPALLGVSHMAREEALKVYNALLPGSPQPVYFNPDNDTLILNIALTMATIFRIAPPVLLSTALAPPALAPIVLPPPGLTPIALPPIPLPPAALTLIALPPPTMISFSLTAPALDRFTFVEILDPSNMPDVPEWMASMGIKSFVVRLGF
ncbi:uncharacterized protein Bfra_010925 [Botrytis fragariae]|uniref:2EXR domain-containing protein n=1 Tax=Botrytis fragariae TaxID=1964551 RepID=A0A8H6ALZ3_9HELO|nr:uncharacterized protein Bfra_010925 [Botrytis fragariae]KAF5869725.1 hypothetical protein Bfra_010925 [Botrytis fragariae]